MKKSLLRIAETRQGLPRPSQALEAMHQDWPGWHHSEEIRRTMSESHRRRETLVPETIPWTIDEDE